MIWTCGKSDQEKSKLPHCRRGGSAEVPGAVASSKIKSELM